jgi:uroporphyrinogen decarboxylase
VQIFESHAGLLQGADFERWIIAPTHKIVEYLNEFHPEIPVIGFPRAAGTLALDYALETRIHAVGLSQDANLGWAAQEIAPHAALQGNLDPEALLAGGGALETALSKIYETMAGKPFIFNLGHGVIKETPPEHVSKLCDIVRSWSL